MNRPALALLPLLFAAACASGRPRPGAAAAAPAWLEGESPRWPRARYLLGSGSGEDADAAADRARGELAKLFSARITVDTRSEESETSRDGASSSSQSVSRRVRSEARRELEGVEIAERWRDPAGARWHALAVLPRERALAAHRERREAAEAAAEAARAALSAAADRPARARAAARLLSGLGALAELDAEGRVLGAPAGAFAGAEAARAEAVRALSELKVSAWARGEGGGELAAGLAAGLSAAGLSARVGEDEGADLRAEAAVSVEPAGSPDPRWSWARASAAVTLREAGASEAAARFELSERQASSDPAEARRRALAGLAAKASAKAEEAARRYLER